MEQMGVDNMFDTGRQAELTHRQRCIRRVIAQATTVAKTQVRVLQQLCNSVCIKHVIAQATTGEGIFA
jgi:hypothetical protein